MRAGVIVLVEDDAALLSDPSEKGDLPSWSIETVVHNIVGSLRAPELKQKKRNVYDQLNCQFCSI